MLSVKSKLTFLLNSSLSKILLSLKHHTRVTVCIVDRKEDAIQPGNQADISVSAKGISQCQSTCLCML